MLLVLYLATFNLHCYCVNAKPLSLTFPATAAENAVAAPKTDATVQNTTTSRAYSSTIAAQRGELDVSVLWGPYAAPFMNTAFAMNSVEGMERMIARRPHDAAFTGINTYVAQGREVLQESFIPAQPHPDLRSHVSPLKNNEALVVMRRLQGALLDKLLGGQTMIGAFSLLVLDKQGDQITRLAEGRMGPSSHR